MRGRVEAAARATVAVLDRLLAKGSMSLEGCRVVRELDRDVVFATVRGQGGRDALLLTGTAEVRENPERAAVLAVLDGTNRWTEARRPAESRDDGSDTIAVAVGVLAGPRKGTDYREGTPVSAAVGAERSGYN
jgi:hypothetical protein